MLLVPFAFEDPEMNGKVLAPVMFELSGVNICRRASRDNIDTSERLQIV
jgi:hypothetical protein